MTDPADRMMRAQLTTIFGGAEAGYFTLPDTLHRALRAEAFVREQTAAARGVLAQLGPISSTTAKLADEVVEAAGDGKPADDLGAKVAAAEEAERRARLHLQVMETALEQAGHDVIYSTRGSTIITEHLAPALAETMAAVRKAAPKLAGTDVTVPEAYLRSPEAVRTAYTVLQDAMSRYQALRDAQRAAGALDGGPRQDTAGWFAELRDPAAHGVALGGPVDRPQPYPAHPAARLLWLAALPEGALWMPTIAQQDERAQEFLAEQRNYSTRRAA